MRGIISCFLLMAWVKLGFGQTEMLNKYIDIQHKKLGFHGVVLTTDMDGISGPAKGWLTITVAEPSVPPPCLPGILSTSISGYSKQRICITGK